MINRPVQVSGGICKQVQQDGASYECRVKYDQVHSRERKR